MPPLFKVVLQVLRQPIRPFLRMRIKPVIGYVELFGGGLDGQVLNVPCGSTLPPILLFSSPKIFRLVGSDYFVTQLIYERVAIKDGRTYYIFIGYK